MSKIILFDFSSFQNTSFIWTLYINQTQQIGLQFLNQIYTIINLSHQQRIKFIAQDKQNISQMRVYPNNQEKRPNRYQQSLQQIAKISNYQPIPSIPAISQDFNFTFLAKDYDEINPYMKKSLNSGKSYREELGGSQLFFEHATMGAKENVTVVRESSKLLMRKHNKQSKNSNNSKNQQHHTMPTSPIKLPSINNPLHHKKNNISNQRHNKSTLITQSRSKQILSPQQKPFSPANRYNKSVTIDTRLQTDDNSILEQQSSGSLMLKIQTKSLNKPSVISQKDLGLNSRIDQSHRMKIQELEKEKENFLERHGLLSRDNTSHNSMNDASRFVTLDVKMANNPEMIQEESSSESEDQYIKDSVPGPGSYSISHHSSFSKPSIARRSTRASTFDFGFGSKEQRFSLQNKSMQQSLPFLEQYQKKQKERQQRILQLKKPKKYIPFNCKQETKPQFFTKNLEQKMISPVYYNPRNGIQEELIKKIQRNFKGSFGTVQKRFRTIYRKGYDLGPGSYTIDSKDNEDQQDKKEAHYFLSKISRFS